jgi:hypothetical protein
MPTQPKPPRDLLSGVCLTRQLMVLSGLNAVSASVRFYSIASPRFGPPVGARSAAAISRKPPTATAPTIASLPDAAR